MHRVHLPRRFHGSIPRPWCAVGHEIYLSVSAATSLAFASVRYKIISDIDGKSGEKLLRQLLLLSPEWKDEESRMATVGSSRLRFGPLLAGARNNATGYCP